MKILTSVFLLILILNSFLSAQQKYYFYAANWNLENLFDTVDDPKTRDEEFTPEGKKDWTQARLNKKLYNLSRVIRYMNDVRGPDLLGVEEVEHAALLKELIYTYFCDKNYGLVYFESPDFRGIDVGLIYNKDKFTVIESKSHKVNIGENRTTRLILEAKLRHYKSGEEFYVFVNHWPSRRGGEKKSESKRMAAAQVLKDRLTEINKTEPGANVIIIGDFNDVPKNASVKKILNAQKFTCGDSLTAPAGEMFNLTYKIFDEGKGTYLYKQNWNMLDQMIISQTLADGKGIDYICNTIEIVKPEFIQTKRGKYKGAIFPTYGGWKYLGGFSDHYPIGAKFIIQSENELKNEKSGKN
ncbi:MAG: hypothetical protein GXO87_14415 [Chlorobi bacterium]|nr:hypothetical protein [Chlorobiota bacterium]